MTEAQWLQGRDPRPMLRFLRDRSSARKFRLYEIACCRRLLPLASDGECLAALAVVERYADGEAPAREVMDLRYHGQGPGWIVLKRRVRSLCDLAATEHMAQCSLLRDLFGNPFRPAPALDPAWRAWQGGTVTRLARAAYDERRLPEGTLIPSRLALVADALEDAGCTDAELLGHLRGQGPHVRGCWVLDLILSKE